MASLRKAKRQSWETLVSEATQSETHDPWGPLYKIIYGKYKDTPPLTSMRNGTHILHDFQQITELLLNGLLPDDEQNDQAIHQQIRQATAVPTGPPAQESFTDDDLNIAVQEIKNKKSPGFDSLRPEIVKRSYGRIRCSLLEIINTMWRTGDFPTELKVGVVRTFKKGPDKDPMQIKSYRPITLLPVLGKIAEKLIAYRLNQFLIETSYFGQNQFGFRKGYSTIDALCSLRTHTTQAAEKYVLGLFLDISGAFDNAWWPLILLNLNEAACL